jgi:hypothetical protein
MKRNELLKAIKAAGVTVQRGTSDVELEVIYEGLHVHSTPENEPEVEPEKEPEIEPEVEPEVEPEKKPEVETEKEPEVEPEKEPEKEPEVEPIKEPEVEPVKNEFQELLGEIGAAQAPPPKADKSKPLVEKTRRKAKKGESSPDSFRISGYILLLITDTVFPFTFSFINNMLDKKTKVQPTDLQLNDKDFKNLEPLADQAADYMAINLNPIAGYLIMSTFMYSNNLIMFRMTLEKK